MHVVAVEPIPSLQIEVQRRSTGMDRHEARPSLRAFHHDPVLVGRMRVLPTNDVRPNTKPASARVHEKMLGRAGAHGDDLSPPTRIVVEHVGWNELGRLGRRVDAVGAVGGIAPRPNASPRLPVSRFASHPQRIGDIGAMVARTVVGRVVKTALRGEPTRFVPDERVHVRVGIVGEPSGVPHPSVGIVGRHRDLQEQFGHTPHRRIAADRQPHLPVA